MTQFRPIEAQITRKESRPIEPMQHGDDLIVLDPFPADVITNQVSSEPPAAQQLALMGIFSSRMITQKPTSW